MADTKTSDETAAGTLTGSELVRIVQSSNNRRTTTQAIADLAAGGSGLYGPVLSTVPTSANTGLSNWLNQGTATVADRDTGITISRASVGVNPSLSCRRKAVPATPYTISALIAPTCSLAASISCGIGWYDGVNPLHTLSLVIVSSAWNLVVQRWTSPTAFSANEGGTQQAHPGRGEAPSWMHLVDDGTNVKFGYSNSGNAADSIILFSVAKASGFLGSAGYANLLFFANPQNADVRATLLSWEEAASALF